MRKEAKSRGWVKNVAIVFLAVLAVLTFFSNTILNRSLPEVSGVNAYGGEISTAVRITGTVESSDAYYLSLAGNTPRQIKSILVKAGDEVEAGQVLFELEPLDRDSDAVRNAQKAVTQARDAYQRELIGYTGADFDAQVRVDALQTALDDAKDKQTKLGNSGAALTSLETTWNNAKTYAEQVANELADINQELADIQSGTGYTVDERLKLEQMNENLSKTESALADAKVDVLYAQDHVTAGIPGAADELQRAQLAVTNAELSLASITRQRDEYKKTLDNKYAKVTETLTTRKNNKNKEKTEADRAVDTALKAYIELQVEVGIAQPNATIPSTTKYDQAVKDAAKAVTDAENALQKELISGNTTDATRELTLKSLQQAISDAEYVLNNLLGTDGEQGDTVTTRYAGKVLSIMPDVYVGKEVYPQAQLAQVEINGKGFTLTKSVTNAEAQRVLIGDIGQISSWGMSNTILTLSAIKTDPKNPSTNKILEFDIDGEVMTGQNLEFTIGTRSQYYDMIVPNSAVRPSQNGKMVLVATAKSTPLGTRYIATPVEVEVLDSDSTNSAIRGDLGWSPFIITTSNKPVEANSQVRLAG